MQSTDNLWYTNGNISGFGRPGLDYQGIFCGLGFVVEAKAPGGSLTRRQQSSLYAVVMAGGYAFVVDGGPETDGYRSLQGWLGGDQLDRGLHGYSWAQLLADRTPDDGTTQEG